jgi:hypothetical protein
MLVARTGTPTPNWARAETIDPLIRDFRYLQYDLIFGKRFGEAAFFPESQKVPKLLPPPV